MEDATVLFYFSQLSEEFTQVVEFDVPGEYRVVILISLRSAEDFLVGQLTRELVQVKQELGKSSSRNLTQVILVIKDLLAKYVEAEAEVIVGCRHHQSLVLSCEGGGEVGLVRQDRLGMIYSAKHQGKIIEGVVEAADVMVLGNRAFWQAFQQENLSSFVEHPDTVPAPQRAELLQQRLSAYFLDQPAEVCFAVVATGKPNTKNSSSFKNPLGLLHRLFSRSTFSHQWQTRQKLAGLVFLVLILLLVFSVKMGAGKRQQLLQDKAMDALTTYVEDQTQVAQQQQGVNRAAAVAALTNALNKIEEEAGQFPVGSQASAQVLVLKNKTTEIYQSLSREVSLKPELFLDLSLLSPNFIGQGLSRSEDLVLVYNKTSGVGITVNVMTKKAELLNAKLTQSRLVSLGDKLVFDVQGGSLRVTDVKSGAQKKISELEASTSADLMASFGTNTYIVDKIQNAILRFKPVDSGSYISKSWLAPGIDPDFSQVTDMVIDGNIWLLDKRGGVRKYTGGLGKQLEISGMLQSFKQPTYLDVEANTIYVWDAEDKRIVITSTEGEYQAQLKLVGVEEVTDLVVYQGKVLLLSGSRLMMVKAPGSN